MERMTRLELATSTLARWRSTRWATSANKLRELLYDRIRLKSTPFSNFFFLFQFFHFAVLFLLLPIYVIIIYIAFLWYPIKALCGMISFWNRGKVCHVFLWILPAGRRSCLLICQLIPCGFHRTKEYTMVFSIHPGAWKSVFAVPSTLVDSHIKMASPNQLKVLLWALQIGRASCRERVSSPV